MTNALRLPLLTLLMVVPVLAGCLGSDGGDETPADGSATTPRFGPYPDVDLDAVEVTDHMVESFDGTRLAVTLFRPAHATADDPVPVILNTPGMTNPRWKTVEQASWGWGNPTPFLEAGFVVASQQHRGQGDSEGTFAAHLPAVQGRDTAVTLDWLAEQPFVALDGPGDPVVGMVGFSSGAMGQTITALYEVQQTGRTRIDALAPFSGAYSLNESIAPNGVPRSIWVDKIGYISTVMGNVPLGAADVRMHPEVPAIMTLTNALGSYPDGTAGTPDGEAFLWERSSQRLVHEAGRLDVPMLASTAVTDTIFPLQEALAFYEDGLTAEARNNSMVATSYWGGHGNTGIQPARPAEVCNDAWGGDIMARMASFHRYHLLGEDIDLGPRFQVASSSECLMLETLPSLAWHEVDGSAIVQAPATSRYGTAEPAHLEIQKGPLSLAGIPRMNATVDTAPPEGRIFMALAAGPSPEEARILGEQWMPLELEGPGDIQDIELAGMTGTLSKEETLFLVVTRWVDQFAHHHDRAGAPVVLEDIAVALPVVEPGK